MENPFISIIIPAYNEELSLGSVIEDIKIAFEKINLPYEIIVVDDGSIDNTSNIAMKYGVTLIHNKNNQGKGVALIRGFRNIKGSIIITMDADGSHRAEDLHLLIYPLLKNEYLGATIGARFIYDVGKRSTSNLHLIGNRIINFIILFTTGRFISDSQCGFRAFKRNIITDLSLYSKGFDIESEMILILLKKGVEIMEIPIVCYPRKNGLTRINSFKDGFNIVKTVVKTTILQNFNNKNQVQNR